MADENENSFAVGEYGAKCEDVPCTPCIEEGTDTKAICKCIECHSNFCQACLKLHNKILKSHTVVENPDLKRKSVNDISPRHLSLPLVATCDEHQGEALKMFCRKHDIVCCTVCVAIYHRLCDGMQYIPLIAKGINESQDKVDSLKDIDTVKEDLEQLLSLIKEDLCRLDSQRDEIINKMKEKTNCLVEQVKELERLTSKEIEANHQEIEKGIQCDKKSIETVLNSVEKSLNNIKKLGADNEAQLFIQIKLGQTLVAKLKEQLDTMKTRKVKNLEYEFNSKIESCLEEVESYGNLEKESYATAAELIGEHDVKIESERTSEVSVYSVCILETNEIILADNMNLKLKRFDNECQMVDWMDLGATPYGLCTTGYTEVAVSFPWLHKIHFVAVGKKMVLKWSFKMYGICRGICYSEGRLYICSGEDPGYIVVYDMAGCHLCTFQMDQYEQNLFQCPESILLVGSKMYVADKNKGVVVLNKDGGFISLISDPRLVCIQDVSVGECGQLFVCGKDSKNILQFDKGGNVINEILSQEDNESQPVTVTYLQNPARLLVTSEGFGKIKIFKLCNAN